MSNLMINQLNGGAVITATTLASAAVVPIQLPATASVANLTVPMTVYSLASFVGTAFSLGSMATQNANAVAITGGTVTATGGTLTGMTSGAFTGNVTVTNILAAAQQVSAAGATTILTATSARYQTLLTNAGNGQTYQLPDATTLTQGTWFTLNNNSAGSLVVTNAGAATLYTVPAGGIVQLGPISATSANGTWDIHAYVPSTAVWGTGNTGLQMNTALNTTAQVGAGAASNTSPVFVPQRGTANTGYSGDATHLYDVIGGNTAVSVATTGMSLATTVAPPSGGSSNLCFLIGSVTGFGVYCGSGAPTASAGQGSWYMRTDGTSTTTRAYVNTTGSTVWTPFLTNG